MSTPDITIRRTITIRIPGNEWWTQNRRGHWRAKYRRTSAVRRRALIAARDALNRGSLDTPTAWPVRVVATIHPLTHGRFDPENAAPMVKAIIDALTDAAIWPDDDSTHITGPDYRAGTPSGEKGWYAIDITIIQEGNAS